MVDLGPGFWCSQCHRWIESATTIQVTGHPRLFCSAGCVGAWLAIATTHGANVPALPEGSGDD